MLNVLFKEISVSTRNHRDIIDITQTVEAFVQTNNVEEGLCLISSPHTTTAVIINENENGLIQDIMNKVKKDFPRGSGWLHDKVDDNADAHLASTFLGSSKILSVRGGRLIRGTWQSIFLLEMDGPRTRKVLLELIGSSSGASIDV